jgi:hypothetical protein
MMEFLAIWRRFEHQHIRRLEGDRYGGARRAAKEVRSGLPNCWGALPPAILAFEQRQSTSHAGEIGENPQARGFRFDYADPAKSTIMLAPLRTALCDEPEPREIVKQ